MNRRRTAIVVLITAALVLALAPAALAAAGGGSAGFGGGGGGGGGGRGIAFYFILQFLFRIALLGHGLGLLVLVGLLILYILYRRIAPRMGSFFAPRNDPGRRPAKRQLQQRERRTELAAAEASEEDPSFAPDVVRPAAVRLFMDVQEAWDADDRSTLHRLVAPELMVEWERRLDDFARRGWRNRVKPLGEPHVEYVSLSHRGDAGGDRVVVHIDAKVRDYVVDSRGQELRRAGHLTETVRINEFWTLTKPDGHWMLASIEQGAEGAHALNDRLIATPMSDEDAMRDATLVEGAVAEAVPADVHLSEIADLQFAGDAHAAALDLSVADGRFSPDVLEIAARRAVDAWAIAVDGDDQQLRAIAHDDAVEELLHPGDRSTRLVVRGPKVRRIRIVALDAAATPPTMTVAVDVLARRYLEDRDTTAVLAGSKSRASGFTERWTFALDGPPEQPWRIAAVGEVPVVQA